MSEMDNVSKNVQQPEQLTGPVDSHTQTVNDIVSEAVAQPSAEEQSKELLRQVLRETRIRTDTEVPIQQRKAEQEQRRLEAAAEKQKERLDYALLCIRDNGGFMSRKQLTAILSNKFNLERSTVSKFISSQVETGALFEADKNISASPDLALAF